MRVAYVMALAALAVGGATAVAQGGQVTPTLPPGEGRDLVATACNQCHSLAPILGMRDGAVGWRHYIQNMVLRGAQLDDKEIDTVVDYLSTNLGPGQNLPPAKPVVLPDGAGKELVESSCTMCHDLERVTSARRAKADWPVIVNNMLDRFGYSDPEMAAQISDYLSTHYSSGSATVSAAAVTKAQAAPRG